MDSYYLDNQGKHILNELKVNYVCSIQGNRFKSLKDFVKSKVEKPGEWCGIYNIITHESFVFN
jgi:hypothetical protein